MQVQQPYDIRQAPLRDLAGYRCRRGVRELIARHSANVPAELMLADWEFNDELGAASGREAETAA